MSDYKTDLEIAREAKKIVVDIDPNEHSKDGIEIDLFIEADLNSWMKNLFLIFGKSF